ncbi:hypothetical protein [Streptomyces sp. NPDC048584]|uniref:hypothetical protein n=1 Tax=Streptomyces sp. NPDC048584 TaxID=3365573 RepID=UPI00371F9A39
MFKSKKITVVAGLLGSVALMGLGVVQAVAVENPAKCADDGRGHVRCEDVREDHVSGDKAGKLNLVEEGAGALLGGGKS